MKTSIIEIGSNKLFGNNRNDVIKYLASKISQLGIEISKIVYCQNSQEEIINTLNFLTEECVFVVAENNSNKNLSIKKSLSSFLNTDLVQDDMCIKTVNDFYRRENITPQKGYENEFFIPDGAVPFENTKSHLQGFVMYGKQIIFFLPNDLESVEYIFKTYIIERLVEDFQLDFEETLIKTFGLSDGDILYILRDLIEQDDILVYTYPKGLDVTTIIRYHKDIETSLVDDFIAKVYERLNKFIYASEDVSLETRVFELLKLTNKTLAIAENITGGNIALSLIKNEPKMTQVLKESIVCPSAESKMNRLRLSPQTQATKSAISVEGCYEMAAGLLETSGANIVACASGFLDMNKTSQTVFISIGDSDGIHVYKNMFSGTRDDILENITKTTLFYLIKKIKQNGLFFGEITV